MRWKGEGLKGVVCRQKRLGRRFRAGTNRFEDHWGRPPTGAAQPFLAKCDTRARRHRRLTDPSSSPIPRTTDVNQVCRLVLPFGALGCVLWRCASRPCGGLGECVGARGGGVKEGGCHFVLHWGVLP